MIPEIGNFALIIALSIALMQSVLPLVGASRGYANWIDLARPCARLQFAFVALSYGCLTWAFIVSDFSVAYVANHSNTDLPLIYRISGVWGGHEGSLLLWVLILNGWILAVSVLSRSVPEPIVARVLSVMGMISVGFLLFTLLTSNPFERLLVPPAEGRDLNPLLQDPGLAIHPPMLYMGYVGFSVAFAFAVAAMIGGRLDAAWARWSRPWTTMAWVFLTAGIALGSWWAYHELGWGGWWFWDPVENASFMPWLVGTALMHSLAVTEKRGGFKAWSVFLAIFAFSFSLLGTFLVRSGVLTSVHAFASDPERGVFILIFMSLVVGGSLVLFVGRAATLGSTGRFEPVSRESALFANNVLLVVSALAVLLGTLYPIITDALGVGKISVGPPYFNEVFVKLTAPLAVIVGVGTLLRWKSDRLGGVLKRLLPVMIAAVVVGGLYPAVMGAYDGYALVGALLGVWVVFSTLWGVFERLRHRGNRWAALINLPRSFWGMTLAHIGLGVFIIGVTFTTVYSVEKDVALGPGDSADVAAYQFRFDGVQPVPGPNYQADQGVVTVLRDGRPVARLTPEKRVYRVQQSPMTEAAVDTGLFRDLYVALGEPLGDGSWALRIYHKPYIRWIWLGCVLMSIGGIVAAADKRYRMVRRRRAVAKAPLPARRVSV